MKKRNWIIAALALVMVLGAAMPKALAYFTTYVRVKGGIPLKLESQTQIEEDVKGNHKDVVIYHDGSVPCWVRATAFSPMGVELTYEPGEGWYNGNDGYYYFDRMLSGKDNTTPLRVSITVPETKPESEMNIIVTYESTTSLDADGNPIWDNVAKYTEEVEGGSGND